MFYRPGLARRHNTDGPPPGRGLAAAETGSPVEAIGQRHGGVATTGALALSRGIPTAVAGEAELLVDLRHPDAGELAAMLGEAEPRRRPSPLPARCATGGRAGVADRADQFDPGAGGSARLACAEATGSDRCLTSGALHDAAEVSRVLPAAMIFFPSIAGISHAKEEDTSEADLAAASRRSGCWRTACWRRRPEPPPPLTGPLGHP